MKKTTFFLLILLVPIVAFSQRKIRYKYEVFGSIGATNFLGELGGADREGSNFVRDLEVLSTRPLITGGFRYKKHSRWAFKGVLSLGLLSGSDALTKEKYRNNRNLSFRSPLVELGGHFEFYIKTEGARKIYKISGLSSRSKKKFSLAIYLFTGVAGFYYNPQAKYNGNWYSLRKLNTEGQGLAGGPTKYSPVSVAIPGGIGFRHMVNKKLTIGMEIGVRKTFTDYIDDVSTSYYNNADILQNYGEVAAYFADPSKGEIYGATLPAGDGTSAQRGDKSNKDAYMFIDFSVGYKLAKKRRTRSKF
jgi:hypothetical protein